MDLKTPLQHLVFLLGPMGTGKSTLGRSTAQYLNWAFLDLDTVIESHLNMTVREIFDIKGEAAFRAEEAAALQRLPKMIDGPTLVATGGGTPCFGDQMDQLKRLGLTVYLQTPVATLVRRLMPHRAHRPLLKDLGESELSAFLTQMLEKRRGFYEQSDLLLPATAHQPEALANLILDH